MAEFIVHLGIVVQCKEMRPKLVENVHVVRRGANRGGVTLLERFRSEVAIRFLNMIER
jgi:hypothetical protein